MSCAAAISVGSGIRYVPGLSYDLEVSLAFSTTERIADLYLPWRDECRGSAIARERRLSRNKSKTFSLLLGFVGDTAAETHGRSRLFYRPLHYFYSMATVKSWL
jgi:hypothetical protein